MSTATGWSHINAWLELPRKSNWYQMLKGDSNERFKQRTGVGCNRTSRETCRHKFKKQGSKVVGRVAKESESERACRSRKAGPKVPGDGTFRGIGGIVGSGPNDNRTVHGFICTALVSCPNGYRLYWGVYVRRVSWLTRPYLVAIEPFRRVLYPAVLRRIRRAWLAAYNGMSRMDTA